MTDLSVSAAASLAGWPSERLWLDYLVLGGTWSHQRLAAYLRDGALPRHDDHPGHDVSRIDAGAADDLVAHALNELLAEQGHSGRVAYSARYAALVADPPPERCASTQAHSLRVVATAPQGRVQTSLTRGHDLGHALTCGGCGAVLAWARQLPVAQDVLLRCIGCQALNELRSGG